MMYKDANSKRWEIIPNMDKPTIINGKTLYLSGSIKSVNRKEFKKYFWRKGVRPSKRVV